MRRIVLAVLMTGSLLLGACGGHTAPDSDPEVPESYTTYTDETGLYSISYPADWQLLLSLLEDADAALESVAASLESGLPLETARVIFLAGLKIEGGYAPNVNIMVTPLPAGETSPDGALEAEIEITKQTVTDYRELSRAEITVDERAATIVEWEGSYPDLGEIRLLHMAVVVEQTVWIVTCTAPTEEFIQWEDDLQEVVRSLRILK